MFGAGRGLAGLGGAAGLLASSIADKDSAWGQNAWMLPLVSSTPLLASEASASARALHHLSKIKGNAFARKGIPGLAAALGTYAAAPAGMSLSAYLMNRFKPESK